MSTAPLVAGFAWAFPIRLIPKPPATAPIVAFPVGSQWRAEFRNKEGTPVLATLTTATGGITRIADDQLLITLPASASATWTVKSVKFDLVRTDTGPDVYLGVKFTVVVIQPVTVTTDALL